MSTKTHKVKKPSARTLVIKLDRIFSQYIRQSEADKNGNVTCFTCDKRGNWKSFDCGHYVSRSYKSTRWDEQNTASQCVSCNRFHEGVKDVFALNLQKKYGDDILEKLNQKKNQIKKFSEYELQEMIALYKDKVAELQDKAEKLIK